MRGAEEELGAGRTATVHCSRSKEPGSAIVVTANEDRAGSVRHSGDIRTSTHMGTLFCHRSSMCFRKCSFFSHWEEYFIISVGSGLTI